MKRYASHFLFFPGHGCLKQYVVEMGEGECVSRIFPLTEEVEDTEWLPGVIVLLPPEKILSEEACPELRGMHGTKLFPVSEESSFEEAHLGQETGGLSFDKCHHILTAVPPGIGEELPYLVPYLYYPFDFTAMQPVAGTRRKRLQ